MAEIKKSKSSAADEDVLLTEGLSAGTAEKQTGEKKDDEISLIDLVAVLWKHKKMIIITTAAAAVFMVIFSVVSILLPPDISYLPNKFRPEAQMLITEDSSSSASSMLGSLGGLASMAGVSIGGGSTNSALAGYLVYSNSVMDAVIKQFNFIEEWKIEKYPITESRKKLKELLKNSYDEETGVFSISFLDKDPALACDVVNYVVNLLEKRFSELGVDKNKLQKENLEANIDSAYSQILSLQKQIQDIEYSVSNVYSANGTPSIMMDTALFKMELDVQEKIYAQLKSQYEMLKIQMASEQPVFQILEYAEIPDKKAKPQRGLYCIIGTFAAAFISVIIAFIMEVVGNFKKDPSVVAKFKKES